MLIDIIPKDITKIQTIKRLDITISNLALNESVTLNVLLISAEDELIESKNIILEGSDYNRWSSDDSYIVAKVLEILELEQE